MKQFTFLAMLIFAALAPRAQNNKIEEDAVKGAINALFDGMRTSDTTLANTAFAEKCIMQTIVKTKDGKITVRNEDPAKFVSSLAGTHPKYDERIQFTKILIDGDLASVWTDYKFFLGDQFSHCGVNSFQLLKTNKGWKIIYLIDTRRKDNCNF
ncbi:MAG: hypothetical protein EOP48_04770 [Sphingobacteriales bacterium]|nr:MAG: hypothetical protein EOP48_04770 [Sphingobacteriales bacterium]